MPISACLGGKDLGPTMQVRIGYDIAFEVGADRPTILVVNKADNLQMGERMSWEFFELGLGTRLESQRST